MVPRTDPSPHGSARIAPEDDVVAGSYATWTITYEVGELGLDDGGTVLVAFSQTTDMGEPQVADPSAPNYCRAATAGDARIEAAFDPSAHVRPMKPAVRLTVRDGSLAPGETVELVLGSRDDGSPGMHVQSFPESGFAFRVLVDPHNSERYVRLGELAVDVVPGIPTDLAAVLPSTAAVEEAVDLRVRAEDYWGNVATGFDGDVRIEAPEAVDAPDAVELVDGTGTATVTPRTTGVHRVRVVADDQAARAVSNPLVCRDGVDERTF